MRLAKQLMDFKKIIFDGMVNNVLMFWEQTEKVLGPFMDSAIWAPAEGRGLFKEWFG